MSNRKFGETLSSANLTLVLASDNECLEAACLPNQQLVGCLQWISGLTRPDISHAVCLRACFNAKWSTTYRTAAKYVLRYLKGTLQYSGSYSHSSYVSADLHVFSDADFSQCIET